MITASNITDRQIRDLLAITPAEPSGGFYWQRRRECRIALHDQPNASDYPTSERRMLARARLAEILNEKAKVSL